jgi:hypothetical protein
MLRRVARSKKPNRPAGLCYWWPLNDGPEVNQVNVKFGLTPNTCATGGPFTAASNYGMLSGNPGIRYRWDAHLGDYVFAPGVAASGVFSQANSEITFLNFYEDDPAAAPHNMQTASIWCYLKSFAGAGADNYILLKSFGFPGNINMEFYVDGTTKNFTWGYTVGGTRKRLTSVNAAVLNRWYHLVGTYDGTTQRFYVNGVFVANQATGTPDGNGDIFQVGQRQGAGFVFDGFLWQLQFYNRALSSGEIKNLWAYPYDIDDPEPPTIIPDSGGPTPPPPTQAGRGPLIFGKSATPVAQRNQLISNHSGQKPMLE